MTSGGNIVMIFLIIKCCNQLTEFRVLIGWSRIFLSPFPLNFYEALRFFSLIG